MATIIAIRENQSKRRNVFAIREILMKKKKRRTTNDKKHYNGEKRTTEASDPKVHRASVSESCFSSRSKNAACTPRRGDKVNRDSFHRTASTTDRCYCTNPPYIKLHW